MLVASPHLTGRDRELVRAVARHRLLTTGQLAALAFGSAITARHRLAVLVRLGLLRRFRPGRETGSAPWHYVLGPIGEAMLGVEDRDEKKWAPHVRLDRQLSLERSQRLGHMIGVNWFFVALARHVREQSARTAMAATAASQSPPNRHRRTRPERDLSRLRGGVDDAARRARPEAAHRSRRRAARPVARRPRRGPAPPTRAPRVGRRAGRPHPRRRAGRPAVAVRTMTCPARVRLSVSAGVRLGVSVAVLRHASGDATSGLDDGAGQRRNIPAARRPDSWDKP